MPILSASKTQSKKKIGPFKLLLPIFLLKQFRNFQ